MQNYQNYYSRRDELMDKARAHTEEMAEKYSEAIAEAIRNTEICVPEGRFCNLPEIELRSVDSVTATADEYRKAKRSLKPAFPLAVLNFASYNNPGGKFIDGSSAQEESLCHNSYLYNVLKELTEYYGYNNEHKNRALYTDRAAYTPMVRFETDEGEEFFADVITCAAPNYSAAKKYQKILKAENTKALDARIKFVLDVAAHHNVKTLVLGAYGCGVFGQDPKEVSSIFLKYIKGEYKGYFKRIVFAIPDSGSENYLAFQKTVNYPAIK